MSHAAAFAAAVFVAFVAAAVGFQPVVAAMVGAAAFVAAEQMAHPAGQVVAA